MAHDAIPMPPLPSLQADLRAATERLAHELGSPTAQAPDWSEVQWRVAMAVAVMHGISALLAGRLRWRGPELWTTFLERQRQQGVLRQQRTQRLLTDIHAASVQARVPLVALKGSVLLCLGLYARGERPMSDIDLLTRSEDFEAAGRLIEALGYAPRATNWRHREYQPADTGEDRAFGEDVANPVKIELHPHILERLPLRDVDITAQVFPDGAREGLNFYPSQGALMQHLLLHAAGSICGQCVRFIHLHDIAALSARMTSEDWGELFPSDMDRPEAWWTLPPLRLVNRYFPGRIPAPVMERAAAVCPSVLRRACARYQLSDVSLSSIATPRLHGWEWSRSMAEALAWAFTRLYPGPTAVAVTKRMALDQHAMTTTGWAQVPRWKKGALILAGRAPRAATMYSVRRALDYGPAAASVPYSASTRVKV